jgi:hypothetical protein
MVREENVPRNTEGQGVDVNMRTLPGQEEKKVGVSQRTLVTGQMATGHHIWSTEQC